MHQTIKTLIKVLTPNDLGLTGGHQGGIHLPREKEAIDFFPKLDESALNPRMPIRLSIENPDSSLMLTYIHYNGKLFGASTRDEYRLTGLTKYFRDRGAVVGDELELAAHADGSYGMTVRKGSTVPEVLSVEDDIVILSGTWKTIRRGRIQ